MSRPEFLRRSGFSERKVQRLFGGYNGLVEAAGLVPRKFPISDAPIPTIASFGIPPAGGGPSSAFVIV